ncbi:MAG TPA: thioredoxin domain-containing protein [Paludibacter sp.]|nr:thioredoxin domain-containing protein [Paludibacter sp.]
MNSTQHKYTNSLIHESSPYLLQHAHNPVNWHPWGNEALEKARNENKLIIISIGYAACHWCHVMEHESFEDELVAGFMNEHFVCIKVDREERPDIDQVYMNAVQLISGSGGWPLNCIALPDGRPVYGGTYFPKTQWLDMLSQVMNFVAMNPEKTEQQAQSLTSGIQNSEQIYKNTEKTDFSLSDLNILFNNWKNDIDYSLGGHKRAPKFPLPVGYQFLLHYYHLTNNPDALKAVTLTLDKMALGGIYDQIGGGFSRYSVDAVWKVPHFEKMLYDNAQLTSLYATAYRQTKNPVYKQIVTETLEFIEREMTSPEGAFYASLDADSENVEGKFYVWKLDELKQYLGKNAELIADYYSVTPTGNWEHGENILHITTQKEAIATKYSISVDELNEIVSATKNTLLIERSKRIRPALDDKILTSWNALTINGYIDAFIALEEDKYLNTALKNANFILENLLQTDGELYRNFKNGRATIHGFLDDYAFTMKAFIAIYQATFDEKWLDEAYRLCNYTIEHFYDHQSGMFFYTSDKDEALIARKMELSDNVIPASNSEMAKNLFLLGHYFYRQDFIEMARVMATNVKEIALQSGVYYAKWDILMALLAVEPAEITVVGKDCENFRKKLNRHYLPHTILSGGAKNENSTLLKGKYVEGKTAIYICRNKVCQKPVFSIQEVLEMIGSR